MSSGYPCISFRADEDVICPKPSFLSFPNEQLEFAVSLKSDLSTLFARVREPAAIAIPCSRPRTRPSRAAPRRAAGRSSSIHSLVHMNGWALHVCICVARSCAFLHIAGRYMYSYEYSYRRTSTRTRTPVTIQLLLLLATLCKAFIQFFQLAGITPYAHEAQTSQLRIL